MPVDFDPAGTAAKKILLAGYPPDLLTTTTPTISLWGHNSAQFWEVTLCQWQKRLDPTYDTYSSGTGTYSYVERLSASDVGANLAAITTTGDIGRPLITVAGTMDALLPINLHARAYARAVAAAFAEANGSDDEARHRPAYRLYEVQNGNHIETYRDTFPQLELIQPNAQRAFDVLVNYVEQGIELPRTSAFRAAARSPLRRPSPGIARTCSCREPPGDCLAGVPRPASRQSPNWASVCVPACGPGLSPRVSWIVPPRRPSKSSNTLPIRA
jgi:hypothetical protein